MFIFVERRGGVEKVQRMIDLQDDCPHPAGRVCLVVGQAPLTTRGEGVTSQGCSLGPDQTMSGKKWALNGKMTKL